LWLPYKRLVAPQDVDALVQNHRLHGSSLALAETPSSEYGEQSWVDFTLYRPIFDNFTINNNVANPAQRIISAQLKPKCTTRERFHHWKRNMLRRGGEA
jgi:hypothetical protein